MLFPLAKPLLFQLDPERAHRLSLAGLKRGLDWTNPSYRSVGMGGRQYEPVVPVRSLS